VGNLSVLIMVQHFKIQIH